jgi:hypothetical protein
VRAAGLAVTLALVACATAAPVSARAVRISGNRFVGVHGKTLRLIGVNRSGTEYACSGPLADNGGFGYGVFQGPSDDRSIRALLTWDVNAVALPLNEACWLGGIGGLHAEFTGRNYRHAIVRYVKRLNHFGIYAVIRLSGAAPGNRAYGSDTVSSTEIPMADADHAPAFWRSAARTFKSNPMVIFHGYDEPNGIGWPCLRNGCTAQDDPRRFGPYQATGEQQIVDAIRSAGARQPILISGINFAGDFSQWVRYLPHDPLHQLGADVSSFDYGDTIGSQGPTLRQIARRYPIVVGGFGDTDCNSDYSAGVMRFMDSLSQSYLAWTWNTVQDYGGCSNALLDDPGQIGGFPAGYYSARPSGFGTGVRAHFRRINAHRRYG